MHPLNVLLSSEQVNCFRVNDDSLHAVIMVPALITSSRPVLETTAINVIHIYVRPGLRGSSPQFRFLVGITANLTRSRTFEVCLGTNVSYVLSNHWVVLDVYQLGWLIRNFHNKLTICFSRNDVSCSHHSTATCVGSMDGYHILVQRPIF